MYCILSTSSDPYFNLATEEYLLRNKEEDIFMLYVNEPSIIVGKHQNAISEINLNFVRDINLKVARRLSGGGTVYHDNGNLNFCFISTIEGNNKVDFKRYTRPILEVLWDMGINAISGGRNDLVVNRYKISGNAEHIFKNRVLHHGTLLFESDLNALDSALKVNLSRFNDKSVQSNRSKVANITEFLDDKLEFERFKEIIFEKALLMADSEVYQLSDNDIESIEKLYREKFSTWEWNYGYSPKYEYLNSMKVKEGNMDVKIFVEKGVIKSINVEIQELEEFKFTDICNEIVGKRHFPEDLDWLNEKKISLPSSILSGKDIYDLLF